MRKIIAICLSAGLFLGARPLFVPATEPANKPHKGRVLILENERTLTGDIEQVGEQFRIKRLVGETWLPAEQVLRLCATLEEAYHFLRGRANLEDVDERLRLGDWCQHHGLHEQAGAELKAAAQLRPNDPRIKRLLSYAELARTREQSAEKPAPKPAELPPVDVSAESLGMFASKVQPILMNTCLSCHTAGRGGRFQLTRVSGPGLRNRRSLGQNLAAVLAEVNARQPLASRLLSKAVSIHGNGMSHAPLRNRQSPAYRALETWVNLTVESNPQLREQAVASTPVVPLPPLPASTSRWGEDREAPSASEKPLARRASEGTQAPSPLSRKRQKDTGEVSLKTPEPQPPASDDPVDPDGFNRQFHAQRPQGNTPRER